jgi:hypothetical protein
VGVVIATEGDAELREAEPFAFLSIFLGFRDLPSIVQHVCLLCEKDVRNKKHAGMNARCVLLM